MRKIVTCTVVIASTIAFASDCPQGDSLLKNNTPLNDLCPKGFGQFSPGGLQNAINNQSSNVAMIVAEAENQGVPVDLALAVSYHESEGFNSCAGSDTGVKGPMQLTKKTGQQYGYDRDINEQNIKGGMAVLKNAYNKCGTNFTCLSANYNGSPRPGEQAGWARGVQNAYNQLHNDNSLLASAKSNCNTSGGSNDCPSPAPASDPNTNFASNSSTDTRLPTASAQPSLASSDIIVSPTQI